MAVDRVKCATLSSSTTSSSNSTNSTNRASCLRLDCGVMTNVCSPSLAHDAQSQSPTRPESSPSLNTSVDAGAAIASPLSPASTSLNTNSSAILMQQLNKTNDIHTSPVDQTMDMDSDSVADQPNLPLSPAEQPAMSLNQSPINGSRQEDEQQQQQQPKTADADSPKPDAVADQEPVNRPSSRDSRTSTPAVSPASPTHNEASASSNHSPQPDRESDRKEVSVDAFFLSPNNPNY